MVEFEAKELFVCQPEREVVWEAFDIASDLRIEALWGDAIKAPDVAVEEDFAATHLDGRFAGSTLSLPFSKPVFLSAVSAGSAR